MTDINFSFIQHVKLKDALVKDPPFILRWVGVGVGCRSICREQIFISALCAEKHVTCLYAIQLKYIFFISCRVCLKLFVSKILHPPPPPPLEIECCPKAYLHG